MYFLSHFIGGRSSKRPGASGQSPSLPTALIAVVCLILASGCSTRAKKGDLEDMSSQLKGQHVAQTLGDAKFRVEKTGNVLMVGLLATFTGGLAGQVIHESTSLASGQMLAASAGLVDPGREISAELAKRLANSFGVSTDGRMSVVSSNEAFRIVDATPGSAHFILDVRTQEWKANYLRSQWTRYGAAYGVKVRLIDRAKRTSVREGSCDYISKSEPNPPDYDELVADGAARIRKYMDTFTKRCIEDVWGQLFPAVALQKSPQPQLEAREAPAQSSAIHSHLQSSMSGETSKPAVDGAVAVEPGSSQAVPAPTISIKASAPAVPPPKPSSINTVLDVPQVAQRYQSYLTKPNPKVFAVSDNGGSWMAWGESLNPMVKESIAQRALRGCEERSRARCVLYDVDGKVVYGQGLESKR